MYLTEEQLEHCEGVLFCPRLDWDDENWDEDGNQMSKPFCCERGEECLHQYYFDRKGISSPYNENRREE